MGLMTGNGPLGRGPAGQFNFEPPAPGRAMYLDPSPKRIRAVFAGETIADSTRTLMLHESGHQPVYYFPPEDVRADLLEPSARHTRCPKKGEASYHTIRAGDKAVEAGAWYYPEPLAGAEPIKDRIAFYWDRMDQWFEEDEEVFVHPRDPYKRVDVMTSSRHVRVVVDGEVIADTHRPHLLFETGLPTRYYIPQMDVRIELLVKSDTSTQCPYKGRAVYWSIRAGGILHEDLVWSYPFPIPECPKIAQLMAFYNEKLDIYVDGELQARPKTMWS